MNIKFSNYLSIKTNVLVVFFLCFSLTIIVCDTKFGNSLPTQSKKILDAVNIGLLICGGHLPLAIVRKKYRDQIKTFNLQTILNYDWNEVIADIKSGKMDRALFLSLLAMNLIHDNTSGENFDMRFVQIAEQKTPGMK